MPRSLSKKSSTLTTLHFFPLSLLLSPSPVSISRYPPREYHPTRRTLILLSLSLFHSFSPPPPLPPVCHLLPSSSTLNPLQRQSERARETTIDLDR
ncbi:hypothetical protein BDP81DRAFT_196309 [Colletotrichum phormii]|uniref:Uncharacterized protein n=1 Tax=Colletotrichum phormii TaxID=359342 RepID=A0AAI9ZWF4_9PEZI|nr:uncharacterized protein BDP81DRAFT_196309 [Colletotrichum phormii]KAK1639075.1 hypothetical protein BDP81DRAFT_196309 [Colletotrichum phormii]